MTTEDFDALIARRDELQLQHARACSILEEEGPRHAQPNHRRCIKAYDELVAVQARIDAELEAERASDA